LYRSSNCAQALAKGRRSCAKPAGNLQFYRFGQGSAEQILIEHIAARNALDVIPRFVPAIVGVVPEIADHFLAKSLRPVIGRAMRRVEQVDAAKFSHVDSLRNKMCPRRLSKRNSHQTHPERFAGADWSGIQVPEITLAGELYSGRKSLSLRNDPLWCSKLGLFVRYRTERGGVVSFI
jgi:hypothetical protein